MATQSATDSPPLNATVPANDEEWTECVSYIPESHRAFLVAFKDYMKEAQNGTFRDKPFTPKEIVQIEQESHALFPGEYKSFLLMIGSFACDGRYKEQRCDPLRSVDTFIKNTRDCMWYEGYWWKQFVSEHYAPSMDPELVNDRLTPKMMNVYAHRHTLSLVYTEQRSYFQRKRTLEHLELALDGDLKMFSKMMVSYLEFVEPSREVMSVHGGDTIPYGHSFFNYLMTEFGTHSETEDEDTQQKWKDLRDLAYIADPRGSEVYYDGSLPYWRKVYE